jgi:hypothetical protein
MGSPKRLENETFEQFQNRRWWMNKMDKDRAKGVVTWCSAIVINTGNRINPVFKKLRVRGTYKKGMKKGNAYQQL